MSEDVLDAWVAIVGGLASFFLLLGALKLGRPHRHTLPGHERWPGYLKSARFFTLEGQQHRRSAIRWFAAGWVLLGFILALTFFGDRGW